jgi:hypothetical protein
MESFGLAKYEEAKRALAACARIDEVKDIQDKSEAMRLYAKISENTELEVYASTIKLRAQVKLGEIIAAMEKFSGKLPTAGTFTKTESLTSAGISKSSANRYERIASIPATVLESYIARKTEAQKPVSLSEVIAIAKPPKPKAAPDAAVDRQRALE